MTKIFNALPLLLLASQSAFALTCENWNAPVEIGQFRSAILEELSGMVFSRRFPDRIYAHNDSGSEAEFFVTRADGSAAKKVSLRGIEATDLEDISYGPCGGHNCIYLADIGDNDSERSSIQVHLIQEREVFPVSVSPIRSLELNYPRGAHNAEALAVHPNGDLYIVTKEYAGKKHADPARLFRVRAADIAVASGPLTLESMGNIDVPTLAGSDHRDNVVTGMDISPDGKRFILLTYRLALEFDRDLSQISSWSNSLTEGRDFGRIPLRKLDKQEAIAYLPDGSGFAYTTELGDGSRQPLLSVTCGN